MITLINKKKWTTIIISHNFLDAYNFMHCTCKLLYHVIILKKFAVEVAKKITILHRKNDFVEKSTILLDTGLKIIYVGPLN